MNLLLKKSFSIFFALSLIFSPLAGTYFAPKAEAQEVGAAAGCAAPFVASYIQSLFSGGEEVPVDDLKNNLKECMDAVAYAVAKTLLAELTNSIVNWINTGFEGNPFYIGDSGSFFRNTLREGVELAIGDLERVGNMYFDIIRQEVIYDARRTLRDTLDFSLDADIISAVCGSAEYENQEFCSEQLTPEARMELTSAFTRGYLPFQWSTWDSLTQNCGNNIFCANTYAVEYALQQRQERVTQLNTELNRSGGFLDQKVCKDPGYERDLEDWQAEIDSYSVPPDDGFVGPPDPSGIDPSTLPPRPVCAEYTILTPGRTIADKITSNLGTSERQLELADELNESIAAIFNALINKLIEEGLKSFKDPGDGSDEYYRYLEEGNTGFGQDRTIDALNRDADACERAGGIYDDELEVCDFSGEGEHPLPWTMDDGTIITSVEDFDAFVADNPDVCIEIDGERIRGGTEPCLVGISSADSEPIGTGDLELTITPDPLVVGSEGTFTISGGAPNTDYGILYSIDGGVSVEFLTAGATDANGDSVETVTIPPITEPEVTIIIDFDEETLEQTVQVTN